ncbi:hypothetical protein Pcinc_021329 [Petrolisthes cinctipes]|uniref:Uncharacterized protein n=1 Tax=Petrolisthes cinctipes TaxID=88211 RepID=A0AAE1FKC7_PETCI|nr:hypothetical protein Pcinc_021329 [Petrolisthes cinctipes]
MRSEGSGEKMRSEVRNGDPGMKIHTHRPLHTKDTFPSYPPICALLTLTPPPNAFHDHTRSFQTTLTELHKHVEKVD